MPILIAVVLVFLVQAVLHAQGAASDAIAVSNTGIDALVSQAVISAASAYGIEALKTAGWFPLITPATSARAMKIVGAFVALITSLGIHYQFDPTIGALTITGLTVAGIKDHGYDWLRSWVLQQITYDRVIDPPTTAVTGGA